MASRNRSPKKAQEHLLPPAKKPRELSSKFADARAQLHLSAMPKRLICREKEQGHLRTFLLDAINSGEGSTLYISGVPGTGKTATVMRITRELQDQAKFRLIELNGMQMRTPEQAYVLLWKRISDEKAGAQRAAEQLDEFFSKKQRTHIVVLVDELDLLITKNEKVLYNLFEWPARRGSRLIVIGIANTMDLPERLSSRIGSRMGTRRLIFPAYTSAQMELIMKDRVASLDIFAPDSMDVCTKRLAASSGDLRGALSVCIRATEIAEAAQAPRVTEEHVNAAVQELLSPPRLELLKSLSMHEKVFIALVIKLLRTGPPPLLIDLIEPCQLAVPRYFAGYTPSVAAITMTFARLRACQLLTTDDPTADLHQQARLHINELEVRVAFAEDSLLLSLMG